MHPNSKVTGIVTEGGEVEKSFTEMGSEREENQQIDKWGKKVVLEEDSEIEIQTGMRHYKNITRVLIW